MNVYSDDLLRGPTQELDLGSDDDEEEVAAVPSRLKRSKQQARPLKIVPTGSDDSSDESDEDGPVTMANMEARSKALDARAAKEAAEEAEELQLNAADGEDDLDDDMEEDEEEGTFQLPTVDEREEEKKSGGPDVHTVQRRMRACVRVLGNFAKRAAKGR